MKPSRAMIVGGALLGALVAVCELRLWRECLPPARGEYARHAAVAYDVHCDERTPQYALFLGMLDCATARRTVAKGELLLALECVVARHPFVSYWRLVEPVLYPTRERVVDWAMGVGGLLVLLMIISLVLPHALALRREERLHGDLHRVVGALNRSVAAGAERALAAPHASRRKHKRSGASLAMLAHDAAFYPQSWADAASTSTSSSASWRDQARRPADANGAGYGHKRDAASWDGRARDRGSGDRIVEL